MLIGPKGSNSFEVGWFSSLDNSLISPISCMSSTTLQSFSFVLSSPSRSVSFSLQLTELVFTSSLFKALTSSTLAITDLSSCSLSSVCSMSFFIRPNFSFSFFIKVALSLSTLSSQVKLVSSLTSFAVISFFLSHSSSCLIELSFCSSSFKGAASCL